MIDETDGTRVVISIQHPAHVHFFRPIIEALQERGHATRVFAREKEVVSQLLERYEIPHTMLAGPYRNLLHALVAQSRYEARIFADALRNRPDVLMAIGEPAVAHVSKLLGTNGLIFTDTEHVALLNRFAFPFATRIYTPESYTEDLGARHVRYPGYHELSYLHPNRFSPDPSRLEAAGVDVEEPYYVVRSTAWNSFHDTGMSGLSRSGLREIVSTITDHGPVYITSEAELPRELAPHRLPVPPHVVHDLLYYADGFIGDSGTMATEAAVLGTPAIRADPFVEKHECGNFIELEDRYGLLYSTADEDEAIRELETRLSNPELKGQARARREELLSEKIDVARWVVEEIERLTG